MLDLTRRRFLTGLVAAPIVITTPGLLMPVKAPKFILPDLLTRKMVRVTAVRLMAPLTPEFGFPSVYLNDKPCAVEQVAAPDVPGRSYSVKGFPMENVSMQGLFDDGAGRVETQLVSFDTWGGQYVRKPDFLGAAFFIGEGTICPPGRFVAIKVEDIA